MCGARCLERQRSRGACCLLRQHENARRAHIFELGRERITAVLPGIIAKIAPPMGRNLRTIFFDFSVLFSIFFVIFLVFSRVFWRAFPRKPANYVQLCAKSLGAELIFISTRNFFRAMFI